MPKQNGSTQCLSIDTNGETRKLRLKRLDETIIHLMEVYQNLSLPESEMVDGWTAKDILGHITFWHESFARNLSDLIAGRQPKPLKGTYVELNQRSVEEMKDLTLGRVIERLLTAHQIIQRGILSPSLTLIPYRKGSRAYTPEEHLDVVNGHISEHLKSIEKVRQGVQKVTESPETDHLKEGNTGGQNE